MSRKKRSNNVHICKPNTRCSGEWLKLIKLKICNIFTNGLSTNTANTYGKFLFARTSKKPR